MARYIDADKLKEHIKDLPTWWADSGGVYGVSMKYPEGMFDCEDIINSIDNQPTADVVELKNMKWIQRYRISQAAPPMGGKHKDGWNCSVCGKHSYSRKEVCDGCKTIMWKVEIK